MSVSFFFPFRGLVCAPGLAPRPYSPRRPAGVSSSACCPRAADVARARAAGGAASIMRGQCWAYSSSDGPAFCRNAWDTRARNGQRRTTASILAAGRDTGGDGKVTLATGRRHRAVLPHCRLYSPGGAAQARWSCAGAGRDRGGARRLWGVVGLCEGLEAS